MVTIRTSVSNASGFTRPGRSRDKEGMAAQATIDHLPPKARGFLSIPTSDALEQMIERAVAALHQGLFWDRGSILNLEA
jgi:hypothetical protein